MHIPLTLVLAVSASTPLDVIEWLVGLPVAIFRSYSSLVRWGADSVQSLFESYGYWVVFLGTLCENTLLVGLIVPGALVVILAGLAAQDGTMSFPVAVVLGIAGTIIGDTISYCMGRFGWARIGGAKGGFNEFTQRIREPILRRGTLFVLLYHFAGYTRVVGPAGAGILKMPYRRWAPADYAGATLWICSYMAIGYGLGVAGLSLDSTDKWFKVFEWGLLIVMGVWGYYMLRAGQRVLTSINDKTDESEEGEPEAVGAAEGGTGEAATRE